ncbi:MAG: hypothetical protein M3478_01745, partial [Planctomycetota bacterium]|nr:hypothetical protein [Planctomycetota bacterium]
MMIRSLCTTLVLAACSTVFAADDPIRIDGPEQSQLDVSKINGNLPPLPGVPVRGRSSLCPLGRQG